MPNEPLNPFRREMYDSLEAFVDHVSDLLGCPITLEDTHHRVLVYSSHDDETDIVRISTIISRRVPEKVINRLWKDGVIPQLLQSKKPIRIQEKKEIGLGNRVAISIWRGEEVIGYIWAVEIKELLTDEQMRILEHAAAIGKHLMSRFGRNKGSSNQDNQEFFWRLLTGHIGEKEAEEKLKKIGISASVPFTIMVCCFNEVITKEIERHILYLLKIAEDVKIILSTIDDNELIILTHPMEAKGKSSVTYKKFIQGFQKHLKERFCIADVKGSFGGIYKDAKYIGKSYKEAKTVLEVQQKFPKEAYSFINYQDLGIYQFLDVILEKRKQDGVDNLAIKKLDEYDKSHNTELLATLEAYLDESESMQKTVARLHIHANTLSYRLKRIGDIMEIDLTSPAQKFMLYLDLKLLHWLKT
ncbi:CdaR family transcriptional regulator [Niallia sp. NCCP-28]|uniref:PucR family transcriptional regulator n=1 Tax=Niallia sp. NCCP-28 TaxID=2934712 RepID=UPI0020875508|nr:helix-turn-helix domain-containing protein [Niallia sp. NCCP-28]GKU83752.1 transcriptional activator AdeR [Niallia sp. NCCP-28]